MVIYSVSVEFFQYDQIDFIGILLTLIWLRTTVTGGVIFSWGWGCNTVDITLEFGPKPVLCENVQEYIKLSCKLEMTGVNQTLAICVSFIPSKYYLIYEITDSNLACT